MIHYVRVGRLNDYRGAWDEKGQKALKFVVLDLGARTVDNMSTYLSKKSEIRLCLRIQNDILAAKNSLFGTTNISQSIR